MKKICKDIFTALNREKIAYCHFKSNKYLDDGLEGTTDLDVLVASDDYNDFIRIITSYGFKKFEPNEFCKYPGVTNWYCVDIESGIIIHIHLHTHLITGKSLIKDYIIPWEDAVLHYSHESDQIIKIDDAEIELLLLFVRLVVKRSSKERIKSNGSDAFIPEDEWTELLYLRGIIDRNKVKKIYYDLFGEDSYLKYCQMILEDDPIPLSTFREFERFIRKKYNNNRRMSSVKAEFLSFLYRARRKVYIFSNQKLNTVLPVKKRCINKGPIFAFIGIDGSGKSTMIKEITDWLGEEFDVKKFYLGAGQENSSVVAKVLIGIYQSSVEKHEGVASTESNMTRSKVSNSTLKDLVKAYFASFTYLMIAKSNYKSLKKAVKLSNNGGIALCDRIPQSDLEIVHDGMKVQRYERAFNKSICISYMAKRERDIFDRINSIKSNLYIVRMNVDPEVSYARKTENEKDASERRSKANTLRTIRYENANKVYDINCNIDYADVLLSIKKTVWEAM